MGECFRGYFWSMRLCVSVMTLRTGDTGDHARHVAFRWAMYRRRADGRVDLRPVTECLRMT